MEPTFNAEKAFALVASIIVLCLASHGFSATTQKSTVYEAEGASIVGGTISSSFSGYSGTGYVDYQNTSGDYVEWTVSADAASPATLVFRYALLSGDRPLEIQVNGVVVAASHSFPATGAWKTFKTTAPVTATLNAGSNTVRATSIGSSGGNLDYLMVTEAVQLSSPIMTVYEGANLTGVNATIPTTHTVYSGASIPGGLHNQISSFVLEQGYMAVVADQADGMQPSKTYIASDGPLTVNGLPSELENAISFIRVVPWKHALKKGVCGGSDTLMTAVDVSWYYNWGASLERGVRTTGPEFVPMSWGSGGTSQTNIDKYLMMDQVTHLQSFNEPDGADQANIPDIALAVQLHSELQKAGLRLGSPACREEGAPGATSWLAQFATQADAAQVRVDYINVHWYDWGSSPGTNTNPDPVDVANRLKVYLSTVYKRYRKPIWITEFNANKNRPRTVQDGFLQEILPYLEDIGYVERYAYYQWNDTMVFEDPVDGSLTTTGQIYRDHPSTIAYVPGDLPDPWQSSDIGTTAAGASIYNGNFTISGSGAGITGTADGFRYVYQPFSGDVTIIAQVTGQIWRNQNTMAGVMLRDDLTAGSRHASMILTWANGAKFRSRSTTDGSSATVTQSGIPKYPYWVKLVREGDTLSGYHSPDGTTWTQSGTQTIAMGQDAYVGLAVSAYNDGNFNDVIFKNVTVITNSAPTIDSTAFAIPDTVAIGEQTALQVGASDADSGDTLTYTWTILSGPAGGVATYDVNNGTALGNYVLTSFDTAGTYTMLVTVSDGTDSVNSQCTVTVTPPASVANTEVFYNNSSFDTVSDNNAVATDKSALPSGGTGAFANYTSYAKGINGIMIDVDNLVGTPDASDFTFKAGNDSTPSGWDPAPAPASIALDAGAGQGGSDRIVITWADGAIVNQWLEVTVNTGGNIGLGLDYVFYYGNAIAETGGADAVVDASDVGATTTGQSGFTPVSIDNAFDCDRDGDVDAGDVLKARSNQTGATILQFITP